MKYTEDNLRTLFGRGLSFDQIAAIFNAANPDAEPISRSVIAGKVKRLGLKRTTVRPNKNTISIKPRQPVEMTKSEMQDMLRRAVENTK